MVKDRLASSLSSNSGGEGRSKQVTVISDVNRPSCALWTSRHRASAVGHRGGFDDFVDDQIGGIAPEAPQGLQLSRSIEHGSGEVVGVRIPVVRH